MPIQSDDIKLLKSAVMADVPEGGGAATGIEIIDGQSNNIFPDTSTDDRAAGRVNFRKVFGAAHTDDTDTLLGASFAVLAPPTDPLVHVTLFETPGWADERTVARELVERYMVKGPRLPCRILDTHYAGSSLLQLYQVAGSNFPVSGDAVCLRNPNGQEQYVRVTKVTMSTATFTVSEGNGAVTFTANIAICEIGQALQFDVLGPPPARVINETAYAQALSTAASTGVAFYGVKPLAEPAVVGDRAVWADGGIFTPIVPAATIEEPLVDIYPLTQRSGLSRTALGSITLPAVTRTLAPGSVVTLPTRVEPGTLSMTHGGTTFAADPQGALKQGSTVVGQVDHRLGTVTLFAGAPSYGSASNTVTYKPATLAGATAHSDSWTITTANQGLGWVYAFEPPPAPGTFGLSYLAQGRWYELTDDGAGKVSGADGSYGAGTLSYSSGSLAVTLGALPDVGSALIFAWGTVAAAVTPLSADLPTRAYTEIVLPDMPKPGTLVVAWARGATEYTAALAADGTVTGPAQMGRVLQRTFDSEFVLSFSPDVLPSGNLTVSYEIDAAGIATPFTNNGGGSYTLHGAPIEPHSVRFNVLTVPSTGQTVQGSISVFDDGAGLLRYFDGAGQLTTVGAVNYTTGALTVNDTATGLTGTVQTTDTSTSSSGSLLTTGANITSYNLSASLQHDNILAIAYLSSGTTWTTATPVVHIPAWRCKVRTADGLLLRTQDTALSWGGTLYTSKDGTLQTAWSNTTGAGTVAGSVSSEGVLSFTAPPASGTNSIVWHNAAHDLSAGLAVHQGVFRVLQAPIKIGAMQLQSGARVGIAADTGVITGGGFTGLVDFGRGIVRWSVTTDPVPADTLTYNAVFLQYLPLDGTLLGLETARLPLDGRVPIYRAGGQVIVHNTLTTQLPNPLTKGVPYSLGRERVAAVLVRTLSGAKVSGALYTVDFNAGTLTFPVESDLTGLDQPFTVHHRIEDELMLVRADISGKLDLVAGLTHDYPAGTSYVSSKLRKGDLFARAFFYAEQATWTGVWSDELIGSAPTASYNSIDFPIAVTNRGAITERWAVIFTGSTAVRVVGETVGQVLTGVSINALIEAINPQTDAPYFSIPALGWGGGWAVGNVLRFNTAAAGGAAWVARTVLQGPATVASDAATIAFRADVDA